jgi:nucleotide-binding universal stress UspA family protein
MRLSGCLEGRGTPGETVMKLDKVLVPLDGSPLAEAALTAAVDLVRERPGATLILLRAAEASTLPGADPTEAQVRVVREAESYLEAVAARLAAQGLTNVKTPAIVEAARAGKVDLIVMSTHGRSGLGRLLLGSVAESVIRGTRTPILLVRDVAAPVAEPTGSRVEERRGAHV